MKEKKIKTKLIDNNIVNYIISSEKYKLIFFLTIILVLYGGIILTISVKNIYDSILVTFQFPIFCVFLFMIFFFNTINTCTVMRKLEFYLIRLGNKKRVLNETMKNVLIINIFHFFILFILYISVLLVFTPLTFELHSYNEYIINNGIYTFWFMVRYVLYISILMEIVTMIYYNENYKLVFGIILLTLSGFVLYSISPFNWKTNGFFGIIPWNFFLGLNYDTFLNEFFYSCLLLIIFEVIIIYLNKKLNNIGENL